MQTSTYLSGFHRLRPQHEGDYAQCAEWLAQAHTQAEETRLQGVTFDREEFLKKMRRYIARFGPNPLALGSRGADLDDFLHTNWDEMRIFRLRENATGMDMAQRMQVFAEVTEDILQKFYPDNASPVNRIIHVTCTGYVSPSAVQKTVMQRGWGAITGVLHAYHMGCYASMPAIRMGVGLLSTTEPHIDIVHTELCTLHLNPSLHTPEQLVVQSLFADGFIKYSLHAQPSAQSLEILALSEEIIPNSISAIGWGLGAAGFEMLLSREVPDIIAKTIEAFVNNLWAQSALPKELLARALFAIHPGGPRIIDKVAETLNLKPEQVSASKAVLFQYGNMSSATLPHVWQLIAEDSSIPSGTPIVSLAFGPGLTVYGCLLRKY